MKSVLNKDQNHHYYKMFLEKGLYQLAKKVMIKLFDCVTMLIFGKTKEAKKKIMVWKNNNYLEC